VGTAVRRVLVVDDHPIVREGITLLLAGQSDLQVCGSAVDIPSALHAVREQKPDVALIDLSLGPASGLDLIAMLSEDAEHEVSMLALSMHDEALYAKRALRAGARGYIMKHEGTDLLLQAIRTVVNGQVYVSQLINATLLRTIVGVRGSAPLAPLAEPSSPLAELSNRELEVYRLVGQGLSTKEIATQLYLSAKTVESHRTHIRQKLGLDSTAALIAHAAQSVFRGRADERDREVF